MNRIFALVLLMAANSANAIDLKDIDIFAESGKCRFNNNDGNWGSDEVGFVREHHYYNASSEQSPCWSFGSGLQRSWYRWELRATNYGGVRNAASFPVDENSTGAAILCPGNWPHGCPTQHFTSWGGAKSAGIEWAPQKSFLDNHFTVEFGLGVHYWEAKWSYCLVQENGAASTTSFDMCDEWRDHGFTLALRPGLTWLPRRNTSFKASIGFFPHIQVRGGDKNDKAIWNNIDSLNVALISRF